MSEPTPAGEEAQDPQPRPEEQDQQTPGGEGSAEEPQEPTLLEWVTGAREEPAPDQEGPKPPAADQEHGPTLAELLTSGKGIPQAEQTPSEGPDVPLEKLIAEALAEADAQAAEVEEPPTGEPDSLEMEAPEPAAPRPDSDEAAPAVGLEPRRAEAAPAEVTSSEAGAESPAPGPRAAETADIEVQPAAPAAEVTVAPSKPEPAGVAEEPRAPIAPEAPGAESPGPVAAETLPESGEPEIEPPPVDAGQEKAVTEAQAAAGPAEKAAVFRRRDLEAAGLVEGPSTVARYGLMRRVGQFRHSLELLPAPGTRVVLRTHRGVELGKVVSCVCEEDGVGCIRFESLAAYLEGNEGDYPLRCEGEVLRVANSQDLAEYERGRTSAKREAVFCRQCVGEMQLPMRIVAVDHLLGGGRIIFYFTAEHRVDFRALVQRLSSKYRARIEMRQVGARDEARLVADYEKCGRRCCCQAFLKDLKPVSMRMAKMQKASLDPSKISGRCGRLMCCMRYEDKTYQELRKQLPPKKTWVRTASLVGKVLETSILAQLIRVSLPDGRTEVINNEDILERDVRPLERVADTGSTGSLAPETAEAPEATGVSKSAQELRPRDETGDAEPAAGARRKRRRRGRRRRSNKKAKRSGDAPGGGQG